MEAQLKEELKDDNLCFETSSGNISSLSVIEKYDRFLQKENSDVDSDADDFFPDDTMLRREYAQLRRETANYKNKISNNRLSTGLPAKCMNNLDSTIVSVTDDDTPNGSVEGNKEAGDSARTETGLIELGKLLQKLEEVRNCDKEEGNSVDCTESELIAIQERYTAILDFIYELGPTFEKTNNSKDSDSTSQHLDEDNNGSNGENNGTTPSQSEDMQMLTKKMESVSAARDRFHEIEQQVREQIEQLELVERYKMESVS